MNIAGSNLCRFTPCKVAQSLISLRKLGLKTKNQTRVLMVLSPYPLYLYVSKIYVNF